MNVDKDKVFEFLDRLRDSGQVNMMGAVPFIMEKFPVTRNQARTLLLEWMDSKRSA